MFNIFFWHFFTTFSKISCFFSVSACGHQFYFRLFVKFLFLFCIILSCRNFFFKFLSQLYFYICLSCLWALRILGWNVLILQKTVATIYMVRTSYVLIPFCVYFIKTLRILSPFQTRIVSICFSLNSFHIVDPVYDQPHQQIFLFSFWLALFYSDWHYLRVTKETYSSTHFFL